MPRNWCEPESSGAAPRSNDRESDSRDSTITWWRRTVSSTASSPRSRGRRLGRGRLSLDHGRRRSATRRCIGFRFWHGRPIATGSGQTGSSRCRAAAPRRGTVASPTAMSRSSISSSRPSSPGRAPHGGSGAIRSRWRCRSSIASSSVSRRHASARAMPRSGTLASCISCSARSGTAIGRSTFSFVTPTFAASDSASQWRCHCRPTYVAVKFYTGPALPDTETNRTLLFDLVQRVARRLPVVMLDTAWSVDEHRDYEFDGIPGVTTLRPSLDPKTNLGLQTQVICWRQAVRRYVRRAGVARAAPRRRHDGGVRRRSVPDDASLCGEVRVPPIRCGALLHTQPEGAARRGAVLDRNVWIKCQDRSNKPQVTETRDLDRLCDSVSLWPYVVVSF